MITSLHIDNFKCLMEFHLPLTPFTCLIGLNGAGKSTLLQALDFLGQLTIGGLEDWLELRQWRASDLIGRYRPLNKESKSGRKSTISFQLGFKWPDMEAVEWEGLFNTTTLRCTTESIRVGGREVLKYAGGMLNFDRSEDAGGRETHIPLQDLTFQGSVFSVFHPTDAHAAIVRVKETMSGLKSLDMLSPHLIRKRAREGGDIGYGGERLSAFIHDMGPENREKLKKALNAFYPQVEDLKTSALRAGWKNLKVIERHANSLLDLDARHVNDGMLRVLAILAQLHAGHRLVLFDEIENGINPELIDKLVQSLIGAEQQVMVTTHSPMILNYLPDEVARKAVVLLYKTPRGYSRAVRFFDLPVPAKKLDALGPGEVFVDTYLEDVVRDLDQEEAAS